jgi:hypothetical protein
MTFSSMARPATKLSSLRLSLHQRYSTINTRGALYKLLALWRQREETGLKIKSGRGIFGKMIEDTGKEDDTDVRKIASSPSV